MKSTTNIISDAIDYPLVIGDFVTAVWAYGEVSLFKIDDF